MLFFVGAVLGASLLLLGLAVFWAIDVLLFVVLVLCVFSKSGVRPLAVIDAIRGWLGIRVVGAGAAEALNFIVVDPFPVVGRAHTL